MNNTKIKSVNDPEVYIFLLVFIIFFGSIGYVMGVVNMMNTLMNTAYHLLLDTVFLIMAIAVLAGAISSLMSEFGVIALLNKLLSKVVSIVYDLPGASIIGIFTTYMSDNPAILSLAEDHSFRNYFKKYQLPALTNIGTAFGMGLIITTFMISIKSPNNESFVIPALIGNIGAIIGSIVSVRIMLFFTKKEFGKDEMATAKGKEEMLLDQRLVRDGNISNRVLSAVIDGGTSGVQIGLGIIPGVLIVCTIVMLLTNGPTNGVYTGAAYEGVTLLPFLASKINFILQPLFGFSSDVAISVPITSLGAAGAAIGLVPNMVQQGLVHGNDIAVFTAMCMCWSGFLSTHVAMMDRLGFASLTNKALMSHAIGGLIAGISANIIYQVILLI